MVLLRILWIKVTVYKLRHAKDCNRWIAIFSKLIIFIYSIPVFRDEEEALCVKAYIFRFSCQFPAI
jgi:hypothetical protein